MCVQVEALLGDTLARLHQLAGEDFTLRFAPSVQVSVPGHHARWLMQL